MSVDAWADDRYAAKVQEMYFRKDAPSMREIAETLNTEFGANFTRNAVIGKVSRMNLADRGVPQGRTVKNRAEAIVKERSPRTPRVIQQGRRYEQKPRVESKEVIKLRCVEITPRHLALIDLEIGHCRYPYGGDAPNEPITYCGHPSLKGSSWCMPHKALVFGNGTASERAATRGIAA